MRTAALIFVGVASPLLLGSLLLGATRSFVVLAVAFPVALMWLGAVAGRRRTRPALRFSLVLAVLLLLLEASFLAMLNLRGRVSEAAWPLGVPLSSWILLVGVGLLPLLFVPWAYAAWFRDHGLTEEDLNRLGSAREAGGTDA